MRGTPNCESPLISDADAPFVSTRENFHQGKTREKFCQLWSKNNSDRDAEAAASAGAAAAEFTGSTSIAALAVGAPETAAAEPATAAPAAIAAVAAVVAEAAVAAAAAIAAGAAVAATAAIAGPVALLQIAFAGIKSNLDDEKYETIRRAVYMYACIAENGYQVEPKIM